MEQTISWLKTRIENAGAKKLNIIYFGGEPLLHPEAIRRIGGEMLRFCRERGVEFNSGMITNGVLLTPQIADEVKQYGVEWMKITFDGDQKEHDHKRVGPKGQDTFEKIFQNLEKVAGKLKIYLGGNFAPDTADSFQGLIEKIAKSKFKKDIISTKFKPILPEMKDNAQPKVGSSCERCMYSDPEITKMLELREESRKQGLVPSEAINIGPCEYYRRHEVTIGTQGEIYKCVAFTGMGDGVIGHVQSQEFNELGEAMLNVQPLEHPKCKKCPFVPICAGGCRADAYNHTGDSEEISCQMRYFIRTIREELPKEEDSRVEAGGSYTS